jgi:hypothetical protein
MRFEKFIDVINITLQKRYFAINSKIINVETTILSLKSVLNIK